MQYFLANGIVNADTSWHRRRIIHLASDQLAERRFDSECWHGIVSRCKPCILSSISQLYLLAINDSYIYTRWQYGAQHLPTAEHCDAVIATDVYLLMHI